MRAVEYIQRQLVSVHQILHDIADDLTPAELTTRALPNTNLLGFELWHVARTQDWAVHTLARGVPELIDEPRWQRRGRLATPGIGVGMSLAEADQVAHAVALTDLLAYADALHEATHAWLDTLSDDALDTLPAVPQQLARYPIYLEDAMRAEVPWMFEHPPLWRCLAPAIGHDRDHLAQMELFKHVLRSQAR
jgi:hypothetical protein